MTGPTPAAPEAGSSPPAPAVPAERAVLPAGGAIPLLGFGTWQLSGASARTSVAYALQAGYRHLDTATIYRNEAEVGAGLRDSGVDRREVFLTTKCPPDRAGEARTVLEHSLQALGVDAVDLWLVHWPPDDLAALWEVFLQAQADGLTVDVGVSNVDLDQLDEIERATGVRAAVNQCRWSPLLFDRDVLDGHRERRVVLEGYSGLRGGALEHPTVTAIAERLGRTPAQVINRWHLQHGVVTIPRSSKPERIRSNADLADFSLTAEDMDELDAAGTR